MPRMIKELDLAEVSFVDRPAQEGALARIMKGEDGARVVSIAKAYVAGEDVRDAKSFAECFRANAEEKAYWEAQEKIYPAVDALDAAMRTIAGDKNLTVEQKSARAEESAADFIQTLRALLPEVQDELMQAVEKASNEAGDHPVSKEVSMSDENNQVAELKGKLADLEKSVETLTAERDDALAKAAVTDAERAFVSGLSEDERKSFMGLSADERKSRMRKAADEDETVELNGQTVSKSAVGDATFSILKAQADEMATIRKQADADRQEAELARLEKRASDEFAHVPGDAAVVAKALRAVSRIEDEGVRKSIEAVFTQAEKLAKAGFETHGHSDGSVSKSKADFKAKVAEIAKRDGVNQAEAMSKARIEYPDEHAAAYGGAN